MYDTSANDLNYNNLIFFCAVRSRQTKLLPALSSLQLAHFIKKKGVPRIHTLYCFMYFDNVTIQLSSQFVMTYIIYLKLTDADAQLNNINIHPSKYHNKCGLHIPRKCIFSYINYSEPFWLITVSSKKKLDKSVLEVIASSLVKHCANRCAI